MDGRTTSGTKKTVTPPNRVLSTQVAGALRRAAIQGRAVASMTPMTLWQKESSPAATARPGALGPPAICKASDKHPPDFAYRC